MLHTIIDFDDIFPNYDFKQGVCRSSNPYDYIQLGYHLDNAKLFGGENNVSYYCDFSSNISSDLLDIANK